MGEGGGGDQTVERGEAPACSLVLCIESAPSKAGANVERYGASSKAGHQLLEPHFQRAPLPTRSEQVNALDDFGQCQS